MRVLVIEGDKRVASLLGEGLRGEGYSVDEARDGVDSSLKARVYSYDLLLVDVMPPEKTGLEFVRELRAAGCGVPVLMLTEMASEADVVTGLDAGADDYLTKPFGFDELLARVRALLRRGGSGREEHLVYHDVELNRLKHQASRQGKRLHLTPKEFQILEFFILHPEQVVRRTDLLEKLWDFSFDPLSNVVDVHVGHLRRKLCEAGDGDLVHTLRGVGYVFQDEAPK
jgi:two-component system, OmpR family, response regulator